MTADSRSAGTDDPGCPGRSRGTLGWMTRLVALGLAAASVVLAAGSVVVGWPPPPIVVGLDHPWVHALVPVVLAVQASVVVRAEPGSPVGALLAGVAVFTGLFVFAGAWWGCRPSGCGVGRCRLPCGDGWLPAASVPQ